MTVDHNKLAVIHIVKRELGLSEDEYRDILQRETVKESDEEKKNHLLYWKHVP
jgi:phage gp16-like protein